MSFIGGYPGAPFRSAYTSVLGGSAPPIKVERLYMFHDNSGSNQHWTDIAPAIAAGRTPIMSIKFGGNMTWTQAAAGAADAQLDSRFPGALALDISGLSFPPRVAFHHEPEGDDSVANFHAMQLHLVERYKAAIRAAGWDLCFISTGGVYAGDNGSWSAANWLTAISGIDIHRSYADVYEKPGGTSPWSSPTQTWRDPATNLSSRFRIYLDWCVAHGYVAGCPEFGINQWQDDPTGLKMGAWYQACANFARSRECEFFIQYDRNQTPVQEGGATSNTGTTHGGVLTSPSVSALTGFSHLATAIAGGPVISSFSPLAGAPGLIVTILGSNFTGATAVRFGATPATFSVISSSRIDAVVPSGVITSPITVVTPVGSAVSSSIFTVGTPPGGGFVPGTVPPWRHTMGAA